MDDDLPCWLALNRAAPLPRETLSALLAGALSPAEAMASLRLARARRDIAAELRWGEAPQRAILTPASENYPALLRQIPDPPLALFVEGDARVLRRRQIALVGSRRATPAGRETAHAFARELAGLGLVVTSGLAVGIDAASHLGAIDGGGATVAVSGCGPDRVYPRRNVRLAERVRAHGALVTELPPGTPPWPGNFPRRNRIISGLCLGVLVVEAARRSGSLITARLALEQGREVFAVPGSIHNPLARGCHRLIAEGAKLVEDVADVVEELAGPCGFDPDALRAQASPDGVDARGCAATAGADTARQRLIESLGYEPTSFDSLVDRSGLTAQAVSSMLLTLELSGDVRALPGGAYARAAKRR